PKLDPLFRGEVDGAGFWSGDGRIKVLYAPTHGGGSERWRNGNPDAPGARATSWWHRDQVAGPLDEERFEVVLAPHPRHSPGHQATFAPYVDADVVIADGGATIYEAGWLGEPGVLPAWLTPRRNGTRGPGRHPGARAVKERLGVSADG